MGRFDSLPGIDDSNTRRRNVVVGGIYALAGCVGVGAISGDGENSEESDADPESNTGSATPDGGSGEAENDEGTQGETEEDTGTATFEIVSVDHPDEVATGETHTYEMKIENTGDAAGNFEKTIEARTAGVDGWRNVDVVTLEAIEPGETVTWGSGETVFLTPGSHQYRIGDTQWEYDVTVTEPSPQSFSGSGESVEQGIEIEGGLVVIDASHDGESNFQVSLVDESEVGKNFINVRGRFDGSQAGLVDTGGYILEVNADGNWDITVRQPRSGQGEELPVKLTGSGPDVSSPILFTGTGFATGEHSGDDNFQVQIYPMSGSVGEVVFNEIGEFGGETAYSFNGVGWVDVNANGNWSVRMRDAVGEEETSR